MLLDPSPGHRPLLAKWLGQKQSGREAGAGNVWAEHALRTPSPYIEVSGLWRILAHWALPYPILGLTWRGARGEEEEAIMKIVSPGDSFSRRGFIIRKWDPGYYSLLILLLISSWVSFSSKNVFHFQAPEYNVTSGYKNSTLYRWREWKVIYYYNLTFCTHLLGRRGAQHATL